MEAKNQLGFDLKGTEILKLFMAHGEGLTAERHVDNRKSWEDWQLKDPGLFIANKKIKISNPMKD
jgi:hypothetical protein